MTNSPAFLLLFLLSAGCTSETPPPDQGTPPLVSAAESGSLTALEAALHDNPPIDSRDSCQWTPLMKAALNGHLETANRLLELGAAVDLTDKGGYSALMLAASNNHAEMVERLLRAGADVDRVESTAGWSALIWAARQGHTETVRILLRNQADTWHRDHQGKRAEDWARERDHSEILALLEGAAIKPRADSTLNR